MADLPTRTRIVRAARRLFLAHGVAGVSMRRIADEVDVSATAIYRHFQDKDALLDAITEEGFAVFREYLEVALRRRSPLARLRALGLQYLEFAMDHPHHYALIFVTNRGNVRQYPDDFVRRNDLTFHVLSAEVAAAMDAGELRRADPLEAALAAWAQMHGLVALQRAGRFGEDRARARAATRRSLDLLLRGLMPAASSARRTQ